MNDSIAFLTQMRMNVIRKMSAVVNLVWIFPEASDVLVAEGTWKQREVQTVKVRNNPD